MFSKAEPSLQTPAPFETVSHTVQAGLELGM